MNIQEIKENIYFVGAIGWDKRLFDELIPLLNGTSYNSFLIKGSEKTALIDSIYPSKYFNLTGRLKEIIGGKIDYIISHQAEQDDIESLQEFVETYPESKIVTNKRCKLLLKDLLLIPEDRFLLVRDGDKLSLGDKTLQFIFDTQVNWPETMLTYLKEDKILFSCDFFSSHYVTNELFLKDEKKIYNAAKRYYAETMMPFRTSIIKSIKKIKSLDIEIIAPSHGPLYKEKKDFIVNAYKSWSSDKVENEVIIPYVSMRDSTENMVEYLAESLTREGIAVKVFHLTDSGIMREFVIALVNVATIVIGIPAVLTSPHPNIIYATYLINALKPKVKFISIIGSCGLGEKTVDILAGIVSKLKAEIIEPVVVKGYLKDSDFELLDKLAEEISTRHIKIGIANKK